ncbi:MAG: hypothetical protein LBV08_06280 [Clostridiales bacterium]|nr:hypothetical protein [Clostridiales bacterium]
MPHKQPIIGITMGDPASIGPELSARALALVASVSEATRAQVHYAEKMGLAL